MPTYEYECRSCGHRFEKFQSITAPPCEECPECKGKVRRLIGSGGAIIFKGSGFYATDHRSEEYKRKTREEKTDTKKDKAEKKDSSSTKGKKGTGDSRNEGGKNCTSNE